MKTCSLFPLALSAVVLIAGCAPSPSGLTPAEKTELEHLNQDHLFVERMRQENAHLPELRQDAAELDRYKNIDAELAELQKQNAELRARLNLPPEAAVETRQLSASSNPGGGAEVVPGTTGNENLLVQNDVLIPTELLRVLVPDLPPKKLEGKAPIAINTLLESRGLVLTNVQQLRDLGLTEFVLRPKGPAPPRPP